MQIDAINTINNTGCGARTAALRRGAAKSPPPFAALLSRFVITLRHLNQAYQTLVANELHLDEDLVVSTVFY